MNDLLNDIQEAVEKGKHKKVVPLVQEALQKKISANDILDKGLVPGIQRLGERFKDGEVYLPEILISVRAMNYGVDLLEPYLTGQESKREGTVVLGTIEGDLHDIGKNLVKLMFEGNGFHVVDLGVDIPAASFVAAAKEYKADIVAVSALLTTTMTELPHVVDLLESSELKEKVRVIIGGAPLTREFAEQIGADGFAEDCVSAVDEAKRLIAIGKEAHNDI